MTNFFFTVKYRFFYNYFIRLNLAMSQKVTKKMEILFFHMIAQINCDIIPPIIFESIHFEKLDLYHFPAHSVAVLRLN